jgi:hypothetical protein
MSSVCMAVRIHRALPPDVTFMRHERGQEKREARLESPSWNSYQCSQPKEPNLPSQGRLCISILVSCLWMELQWLLRASLGPEREHWILWVWLCTHMHSIHAHLDTHAHIQHRVPRCNTHTPMHTSHRHICIHTHRPHMHTHGHLAGL